MSRVKLPSPYDHTFVVMQPDPESDITIHTKKIGDHSGGGSSLIGALDDYIRRNEDLVKLARECLAVLNKEAVKQARSPKAKRFVGERVVLTRDCEIGQSGEHAMVTEIDGIYMTLDFIFRITGDRIVKTGADYKFLRNVQTKRVMIAFYDYTDLPRAWGVAENERDAEAEARRQLQSYCAKQQTYGETMLADPNKYTMRRSEVE